MNSGWLQEHDFVLHNSSRMLINMHDKKTTVHIVTIMQIKITSEKIAEEIYQILKTFNKNSSDFEIIVLQNM